MKRLMIFVLISVVLCSCYKGEILKQNIRESGEKINIINPDGATLKQRINVPEGFERAEGDGFSGFVRDYKMKDHNSPVMLYNGSEKANQSAHAAVFEMPLIEGDLQQCADSVMRMYAEYYRNSGNYEKLSFHFTNGFLCEYSKWRDGFRVSFKNGNPVWNKSTSYDDSNETFKKYLRMVFGYAGTASMERYESETVSLSDLETGDVILKGGSPGHVVMVADVCANKEGERAFLLAQGYMPAQEFHILNNPLHMEDPWYYESEMEFPLHTPEYIFENKNMLKRLSYKG